MKTNVEDEFFTKEDSEKMVALLKKAKADFLLILPVDEKSTSIAIKMVESAVKTNIPYALDALIFKAENGFGCKDFIIELADVIEKGKNSTLFALHNEIQAVNSKYYPNPPKEQKKTSKSKKK